MIITWYGNSCFNISQRVLGEEKNLLFNPQDKTSRARTLEQHASVIVSQDSYKPPPQASLAFVISEAGEYELAHFRIFSTPVPQSGVRSDLSGRPAQKTRSIFKTVVRVQAEDITLAHIDDFPFGKLADEVLERLGSSDILLLPFAGALDPQEAANLVQQLEPRIAIPAPRGVEHQKNLKKFLKEMGIEKAEIQPKLIIKAKDLPHQAETKVVILEAQ